MAIFTTKEKTDTEVTDQMVTTDVVTDDAKPEAKVVLDVVHSGLGNKGLIVPRISEKGGWVNQFNQYIFTIYGKLNKIEVRRAVEKMYGVKIAGVNMIKISGKSRRFGRTTGRRTDYKKAMVTLTKDSKKINIVEPS